MSALINTDIIRDWVGLSCAHGVGPSSFFALVRRFGSPTRVLEASRSELKEKSGLKPRELVELHKADLLRERADKELAAIKKIGARVLIRDDPDYPELLGLINHPPPVLYTLGNSRMLNKNCVAIVGSRAATSYGRRVSRKIARDLASSGVCVVSGLALGIDGEAHGGALSVQGATVGVLGCGIDVVYPRSHRHLYEQIRIQGLLVSEYPLGTPPEPFRFPARNRIIAGLSRGVVVVEASKKSGSLITVQFGLEEGREIFAVPGQVDSAKSAGAHWLVQQGASLVVSADDILEYLCLKTAFESRNKPDDSRGMPKLDADSAALLSIIEPYPRPRDELLRCSGFSAAKLQEILLLLELEGLVEVIPGDQVRKTTT